MAITLPCSGCHCQLQVPNEHLGKRVRCPKCNTVFEVSLPKALPVFTQPIANEQITQETRWANRRFWLAFGIGSSVTLVVLLVFMLSRGTDATSASKDTHALQVITPDPSEPSKLSPKEITLQIKNVLPPSKETPLQPTNSPVNLDAFTDLYRVRKTIEGAQQTGITRDEFRKLLQQYTTELLIAEDKVKTTADKTALAMYKSVLDILNDSGILWDAKLQAVSDATKRPNPDIPPSILDQIKEQIALQALLLQDKLPVQLYATKAETPAGILAKHYKLPVGEENGWRYIPLDSFKVLWAKANAKPLQINKVDSK